jgi:tetratricopeptide (TPR) repeat protein
LAALKQKLFTDDIPIVALVGLGGVGKTQVALELAFWTKENKPDWSIFWVPALSEATFQQAYTEIARKLKIRGSDDQDVKELVRQYLDSEASGRWLLVVDNADDVELVCGGPRTPEVLERYLPRSQNGRIVFTTRFRDIAARVAEETIELDEFSLSEAKRLLENLVPQKDLTSDAAAVTELLHELTYLPLAITQAAAYLERNEVSIAEYLGLLRHTEKDMVELLGEELPDRTRYKGAKNAVATTWVVSFVKIREHDPNAADLLSFMSQIEPKSIPQSLLPKLDSKVQTVSAIGTLCGYGFVSKQDEMLDMHRLVHLATRIWLRREGLETQAMETAIRHLAESFPTNEHENRHIWRTYLPHALRILQRAGAGKMEERYDLSFYVGRCLDAEGRVKEAVRCFEECWQWRSRQFAEDHPLRLAAQYHLASAYTFDKQIKKAVALLEQVVVVHERTLAEDHPDRLASQRALAVAYHAGRIKEAVTLLEQVVAVEEKTLANDHPDRLASQHTLASTYVLDRQNKKAVALLEQVVAIKERTLDEEHPDRLTSQHALAIAYESDGQIKKAVALLEQVVAVEEKTLANDHPDRLAAQFTLANTYESDGQNEKAVALLEQVVGQVRTLAEDHPDRLASQHALAIACQADSQVPQAVELLKHVFERRRSRRTTLTG